MDDLRPHGTVEVRCDYPGCGWRFWVDCLDPRLPTGPFDCGADHETQARVNEALRRLNRAGLVYQVASGPGCGCGGPSEKAGSEAVGTPLHRAGYLMLRLLEPGQDGSQEAWAAGRFTWAAWDSLEELEALPCDPRAYLWMSLEEAERLRPAGYAGP